MLGEKFPNVTVIDAGRSLPDVMNAVMECIIERHLTEATAKCRAA